MTVIIQNDQLIAEIAEHGAELISLKSKEHGLEYIWQGDPAYWGRHAPVLFPFVGRLKDDQYVYQGKTYQMGQHGFARDMDFTLTDQAEDKLEFTLSDNEETYEKYPFHFQLQIIYEIFQNQCRVTWKVKNMDDKTMYFQIGGHPAFACPCEGGMIRDDYSVRAGESPLLEVAFLENGLLSNEKELHSNEFVLEEDTFARDAFILQNETIGHLELVNHLSNQVKVRVSADVPAWGIWSTADKKAPFVCLEPWYGRCDKEDFEGELSEREYMQSLESGEEFTGGYLMELL